MTSDPLSDYRISLPEFEGPLDLLLHLVKRHEMNVFEIPIAFITERYLETLDVMRALNLDIAGEYLLMAATLIHIKSRELLPRRDDLEEEEEDDDGVDPKEELIRRLLEYQRYKEAAEQLASRPTLGRRVFPRGSERESVDPKEIPLAEVSTFALVSALAGVFERAKINVSYDIAVDRVSISERINEIVDMLLAGPTVRFLDCFKLEGSAGQVRHEIVVTFLAVLEMSKLNMVRTLQHETDGEIYLTRTEELHAVEELEEYA